MIRLNFRMVCAGLALAFLAGFGLHTVLAQQSAALPPDVLPTSLARVPWPARADCCPLNSDEERQAFSKSTATAENPKNPASMGLGGMRAYFPLYAENYSEAHSWLDKEAKLDPGLAQIAMSVGTREMGAGGQREWFIHTRLAREAGVSDQTIEIIRLQKDLAGLSEKEATVIRFAREMVRGPKVTSKTFADMERVFGRRQTLAFSFQVARYAGMALGARAYDVQLEPGQSAPW